MAHGLGEHTGTFSYMAQKLNAAGIGTYQPDHRGHGRSDGERAHLDDFNQLLDDFHLTVSLAIEDNPNRPVFLYGHSMGGFTVSLYSVKYPNGSIRGVITSGAVVRENQGLFRSVEAGRDVHERIPNTLYYEICSVGERVDEFRADPLSTLFNTVGTAYEICRGDDWFESRMKDFAYPVFMTHGEDDCVVSAQDTYDFFKAVSSEDKQMKIYGKAHHAIFNEFCRDDVIGDYITWINNRLG
ncbi:MAG: lysophospholipase, partial [Oscillospiraceae bacterium]|nr:lysophospholipase [Oscillospiraceae bacterium]